MLTRNSLGVLPDFRLLGVGIGHYFLNPTCSRLSEFFGQLLSLDIDCQELLLPSFMHTRNLKAYISPDNWAAAGSADTKLG